MSHYTGPIALDNCNLCIENHLFNENGKRTPTTATSQTQSLSSLHNNHYYCLKSTKTTILLSFPSHSLLFYYPALWTVILTNSSSSISSSSSSCPWPKVPGKDTMNGLFHAFSQSPHPFQHVFVLKKGWLVLLVSCFPS